MPCLPPRRLALLAVLLLPAPLPAEEDLTNAKWLQAAAFVVPKETATEGEGYFSLIEGHNRRLYIGTHANGVNSWLVEFNPAGQEMKIVVDAHKAIGKDLRGFGSQAKIHTRNNVGASGKIYFGTKQGYPGKGEKREDYPGGYPMVYDPATGVTKVYPIPVPHEGINSITPDESRGVAYISTCSDRRPGPGENAHFLILDLKTGKYRNLIDTKHIYGFIVLDHLHRAYHPMLGGDIVRYDPRTDKLERLKQTIDGKPPAKELHLADANGHPINWDVSPDGKTLYALPMSGNQLYQYDLMQKGLVLAGRSLGELVGGAKNTDCRAMCVGPKGMVWAAVTVRQPKVGQLLHLASYRPGDKGPHDHGPVAVPQSGLYRFQGQGRQAAPLPRRLRQAARWSHHHPLRDHGRLRGARRQRVHSRPASLQRPSGFACAVEIAGANGRNKQARASRVAPSSHSPSPTGRVDFPGVFSRRACVRSAPATGAVLRGVRPYDAFPCLLRAARRRLRRRRLLSGAARLPSPSTSAAKRTEPDRKLLARARIKGRPRPCRATTI